MRTGLMIGLIVAAAASAASLAWALLALWLGRARGSMVAAAIAGAIGVVYRVILKPWHLRWGATDEETTRDMPGDDLLPGAIPATRAITIAASPEEIWPWLA
jgi:hypothetical protein